MKKQHFLLLKSSILLIILNAFCSSKLFSQSSMPEARNTIYLTAGIMIHGVANIGLNYERMISPNASIRTGIYYSVWFNPPNPDFPSEDEYISLPITVNYMTSGNSKFEFGLGGGPCVQISGVPRNKFPLQPAGSLGYRYQQEGNSMFFRFGIEAPACLINLLPSIGYHF